VLHPVCRARDVMFSRYSRLYTHATIWRLLPTRCRLSVKAERISRSNMQAGAHSLKQPATRPLGEMHYRDDPAAT
jgi:hypothetical protein